MAAFQSAIPFVCLCGESVWLGSHAACDQWEGGGWKVVGKGEVGGGEGVGAAAALKTDMSPPLQRWCVTSGRNSTERALALLMRRDHE